MWQSTLTPTSRAASASLGRAADREPWILYIGDGFASTGFRRIGDVEQAIASSSAQGRGAQATKAGKLDAANPYHDDEQPAASARPARITPATPPTARIPARDAKQLHGTPVQLYNGSDRRIVPDHR
jgi:hypothetical protein